MKKIYLRSGESIQKALDSIQVGEEYTIFLEKGLYKEKIVINKPNITLIGEDNLKTIIDWDDASGTQSNSTSGSASVTVTPEAENFTAKNITFRNSFDYDNSTIKDKQGVALKSDGDRSFFFNCRFLGNQDTLYANLGRQYYKKCYIEGHVDFVFGGAQAYFEEVTFFSLSKSDKENPLDNGYVFAPSTKERDEIGYIADNCKFLSKVENSSVYLGRPWHPGKRPGVNPSLVIMNSDLGAHIKEIAWAPMSGFSPDDARFYEYNNRGTGAKVNLKRRLLTKEQVEKYSKISFVWLPNETYEV